MFKAAQNPEAVKVLCDKGITTFGVERIPRTVSRAQTFDVLSSQANLSGYKAVVEASAHFGRSFKSLMTAAGKVPPAKVLVIGAGVAGLQAIQTAKTTGAVVRCFDVRAACREQVVSAGGEFLTVDIEEDGSGAGGYAKEMSPEFLAVCVCALLCCTCYCVSALLFVLQGIRYTSKELFAFVCYDKSSSRFLSWSKLVSPRHIYHPTC